MTEDYVDVLNKPCLNCGKGINKRTPLLLYEFIEVVCDSCSYRDDRFKVKENFYVKQQTN